MARRVNIHKAILTMLLGAIDVLLAAYGVAAALIYVDSPGVGL